MMEAVGVEGSRVLFERFRPLHDTVLKRYRVALVALSFCGCLGCDGVVALSRRCSELGFELGDSVLEASAITDEAVHDGGVSLGGGVGDKHGGCSCVCV